MTKSEFVDKLDGIDEAKQVYEKLRAEVEEEDYSDQKKLALFQITKEKMDELGQERHNHYMEKFLNLSRKHLLKGEMLV